MNINRNNYEEFFILYIDNELNDQQREAVDIFIEANPDLKEELLLLKECTFNDKDGVLISFPDKDSLMRYERNESYVLAFARWKVAVAVILLVAGGMFWLYNSGNKDAVRVMADKSVKESNDGSQEPSVKTDRSVSKTDGKLPLNKTEPVVSIADQKPAKTSRELTAAEANNAKPALAASGIRPEKGDANGKMISRSIADVQSRPLKHAGSTPAPLKAETSGLDLSAGVGKAQQTRTLITSSTYNSEIAMQADMPVQKKGALKALWRGASRIIDKATALRNGGTVSVHIGNIEIALQ